MPFGPSARRAALLLLVGAPLLLSGCLSRLARQDVYEDGGIEVFLRTEKRLFGAVETDYDHPSTISAFRVAHILSRLDRRRSADEPTSREPAIPTEMLYSIADGVSKALKEATPEQEVVVMALRKEKSFAVLREEFLTSFVCYVRGDQLFIHLARSEAKVRTRRRDEQLPQPRIGEESKKIRLFGGTAMTVVAHQVVAVTWRDPIFSRPTRTKILPTGEVKRKTILMESPEEVLAEEYDAERLPPNLSAGQLRDLADLEDERTSGGVTESEYRERRRKILDRL